MSYCENICYGSFALIRIVKQSCFVIKNVLDFFPLKHFTFSYEGQIYLVCDVQFFVQKWIRTKQSIWCKWQAYLERTLLDLAGFPSSSSHRKSLSRPDMSVLMQCSCLAYIGQRSIYCGITLCAWTETIIWSTKVIWINHSLYVLHPSMQTVLSLVET